MDTYIQYMSSQDEEVKTHDAEGVETHTPKSAGHASKTIAGALVWRWRTCQMKMTVKKSSPA